MKPNLPQEQTDVDASAKLDALLNAAVDAIIVIDHIGNIESFNAAAAKMFKYQPIEVIGHNVKMLMPEPYQHQHDQFLSNYMQTKQAKIIGLGREVLAQKKTGEVFSIELSVGEVERSSHKQFVGIIRDISDRIQAQDEIREARERLSHITRLSTMGEMAAGIAHEINQPLTAVVTYAQACRRLIENGQVDITRVSGILEKISVQALRAGEVIRRLRAFVKKSSTKRESINISTLVIDSVNLARADTRLLNHGVSLELNDDSTMVIVDVVQIQQVLINLIRNAIDAMEEQTGDPVIIKSQRVDLESMEISVIDFGKGVDTDAEESLFNPFFTTKDSGMGMGLPISQTIVNSHGGRLLHKGGDPRGSIFSFTLPITPELTQREISE